MAACQKLEQHLAQCHKGNRPKQIDESHSYWLFLYRGCKLRAMVGITLMLYPLSLALPLRQQTVAELKEWLTAPPGLGSLLPFFFGTHQNYALLLVMPFSLVVIEGEKRRWIVALFLIVLAGLLDPLLSAFISKNITSAPLCWSVLWFVPWMIFVALGLIGISRLLARLAPFLMTTGAAQFAAVAVFAVVLAPYNVFRAQNHYEFRPIEPTVLESEYRIAQAAVALVPLVCP